jgi:hypothetical protein
MFALVCWGGFSGGRYQRQRRRSSLKPTDLSSFTHNFSSATSAEIGVICLEYSRLKNTATPPACLPRLLRAFGLAIDHCTNSGRFGKASSPCAQVSVSRMISAFVSHSCFMVFTFPTAPWQSSNTILSGSFISPPWLASYGIISFLTAEDPSPSCTKSLCPRKKTVLPSLLRAL